MPTKIKQPVARRPEWQAFGIPAEGKRAMGSETAPQHGGDRPPGPKVDTGTGGQAAGRLLSVLQWLLGPGQTLPDVQALTAGIGRESTGWGIPIDRITLNIRLLHPQIRGLTYVWHRDRPEVEVVERAHGIEFTPGFLSSPIGAIMEQGVEGVRAPIARLQPPWQFPVLGDLAAEGYTDYVAMPLVFSSGRRNVLTLATRHPAGFSTEDLTVLYEARPALTVLLEARTLRLLATNLLNTYVGHEAGSRILSGDIRRGTGLSISAVLWYCDLRGFTPLADRLPMDQLIALLNGYFDIMGGAVSQRGGEILKFIGDAMLAIFPVGDGDGDTAAKCRLALAAAEDAMAGMERLNGQRAAWGQPRLGAGIALHVGEVMYGNIGAPDRLDFTVIGPAVNLVSRLEGLTRRFDRPLVTSAAFATALGPGRPLVSLGFHPVKGLREPVEVYGLASGDLPMPTPSVPPADNP